MTTVTRVAWHVSSNGWADGCDLSQTDVAASFEAWLDALEAALVVEYPEAEVVVYSHAGDLRTRLEVEVAGEQEDSSAQDAVAEWIEQVLATDVWDRGEFWVEAVTPQPNRADYVETVHDQHIGEGVCRECIGKSDPSLLDRLPAWTGDPGAPCWCCVEMIAEAAWRADVDAPVETGW